MHVSHVPFQTVDSARAVRAHAAWVRLYARVDAHMLCERTLFSCPVRTFFAGKRLFRQVLSQVPSQSSKLRGAEIAFLAFVRFLTRVRSHVNNPVVLPSRLVGTPTRHAGPIPRCARLASLLFPRRRARASSPSTLMTRITLPIILTCRTTGRPAVPGLDDRRIHPRH